MKTYKSYVVKYHREDINGDCYNDVLAAQTLEKAKEIFEQLYARVMEIICTRTEEPLQIEKTDVFFEVRYVYDYCYIIVEGDENEI